MQSKVAKNTSNCRPLSISLLGNSVAIKPVLQQQILASIALSSRSLVTNNLPDQAEITLETIPLHRLTNDTAILYRCAIALKLSSLWKLAALDIANEIADSLTLSVQDTAPEETGENDTGNTLDYPLPRPTTTSSDVATPRVCLPPTLSYSDPPKSPLKKGTSTKFSPHPSRSPLKGERSKDEAFYSTGGWGGSPALPTCPSQACLDFSVEVVSPAWIQFRLSDRGLATWLQQLLQISPLLSDWEDASSIGLQSKGEPGDRERKIKNRYSQAPEITPQGQLNECSKTAHTLFQVQYAHARCCSLLRLAHREGLIELSNLECKTSNWQWVKPNPVPWMFNDQEMESEPRRLRLGHPAERGLIAQLLDGTDRISSLTPASAIKLAHTLSTAFETFYSACRIWGEVKTETPQLAQARLGLVAVTQKLLRALLEDQLDVTAPPEL